MRDGDACRMPGTVGMPIPYPRPWALGAHGGWAAGRHLMACDEIPTVWQANTKDCPKCKVAINKDGGCNHMHCKQVPSPLPPPPPTPYVVMVRG